MKIIFLDIDGTIIDEKTHKISNSTINAIRTAKENGHKIFINTGRVLCNVNEDIRSMNLDGYICGCGTEIIINNKTVFHNKFDNEVYTKMKFLVEECRMNALYEASDSMYFGEQSFESDDFKRLTEVFLKQGKNVSRKSSDEDFHFDKFVAWYNDKKSNIVKFKDDLKKLGFEFIDRGGDISDMCCELVPENCSKATGCKYAMDYFGIDKKDSFAIGDSLNDLPMLEAVGTGIAMGNGEPLFRYANYITARIEDDGIEKAFRNFGII